MSEKLRAEQTSQEDSSEDDFTEEDYEIYSRSVLESDGFDVVRPEKLFGMGGIYPVHPNRLKAHKAEYERWARYAIEEHNKHENKSLEFVQVIKINEAHAAGVFYYFTLLVKDKQASDADISDLICRAKVWNGMWGDKELVLFKIVSGEKQ